MKRKTLMGTLLTDFRFAKNEARKKLEEKIWKDNKLGNPTKRGGHELHTSEVHGVNGTSVVIVQLWKKVDEKRVVVSANITSSEVEVTPANDEESVADLLK